MKTGKLINLRSRINEMTQKVNVDYNFHRQKSYGINRLKTVTRRSLSPTRDIINAAPNVSRFIFKSLNLLFQ